ncbi:4,5-DOPA dioxygenase extradiol [Undibacterium sp.]|uniref:4,5-DOPA-extradiol-dioxygenase n=1 Tax=Undibacterium sp. TaxID=1914977 RepID=UPI00374DA3A8
MSDSTRMPAIFFGHGSPMNALEDNRYTQAWEALGKQFPRPKAILVVSAHWTTRGTAVTAAKEPVTIHDFGGFPQALFDVRYPAPGDPALAARVAELLAPLPVGMDQQWGLDHGTWSVLVKAYPQADIPVIQLSIDIEKPPAYHFALGQKLQALRDEGVMVIGTGNVVHNLRRLDRDASGQGWGWAARFNNAIRKYLQDGDLQGVVNYQSLGQDALLSVPTPEHFLPLLYILGSKAEGETLDIPIDGMEMGAISMLSVVVS